MGRHVGAYEGNKKVASTGRRCSNGNIKMKTNLKIPCSPLQVKLLRFIKAYTAKHRYAPSVQEMADGCGWKSKSAPARILNQLVDLKLITRSSGRMRTVALTKAGEAGGKP